MIAPVLLSAPFAAAQAEGEPAAASTTAAGPPPTPQSSPQSPQQSAQTDAPSQSYDPPQWDSSASYDVPPSAAEPAESEAPSDGGSSEPATGADEPSQNDSWVVAQNQSNVIQAIWQVQVGCRTYCQGTSQDQSASQASDTEQKATAIAPEGDGSSAAALNQSSTIQFVWQTQLGCVAFCWNTTMHQSASQDAQTTQDATAAGEGGALAENIGETIQRVWQLQEGCKTECYGVSESQTLSQRQSTDQSASATGPDYPSSSDWSSGPGSVPSWLTAFAESIGATIQTIFQYEEASCLSHCGEEALVQAAAQRASTDQTSSAGDVPKPAPPTPPAPPAADAPAAPAPSPGAAAPRASAASAPAGQVTAASDFERAGERQAERHRGAAGGGGSSDGASPPPADLFGGGDAAQPSVQASAQNAASATAASSPADTAAASPTGAGASVSGAGSRDRIALQTAAESESGGGPNFSWLSVALLTLAALAGALALRSRPPIGA